MNSNNITPLDGTAERPYLRGLAHTAIALTILALLPLVFVHIVRFLDAVAPNGLSQSQGYWLLLPMIIVNILMVTIIPLFGLIAFIFSLIALVKSKGRAHNRAIVALVLIGVGIIMVIPVLQGFDSILFG